MTLLRMFVAAALVSIAACGGGGGEAAPDAMKFGVACTNATFDPCTSSDQCTSANCKLFNKDGIQVCTQACTPNDSSTCPSDVTGNHGTCNMMGICKPAAANHCDR